MPKTDIIIKKEFRELVNHLNTGNKLRNEKTEVYFYIDRTSDKHWSFFATIGGKQKILLCYRSNRKWLTFEYTAFPAFSEFCLKIIKQDETLSEKDLTKKIMGLLFPNYF